MPWEDAGILGLYALVILGLTGVTCLWILVKTILGIDGDQDNPGIP